jgi:hypothetical protein
MNLEACGMKIRALLKQAGISEPAYYALMRQDAVPFMRRKKMPQSSFRPEHLLAMKAFALLRTHGLRSIDAGLAVKAAFPAICDFANERKLASLESYKLGACLFSLKGKVRAIPLHEPTPPGSEELGRVELDLRGIATLLPSPLLAAERVRIDGSAVPPQ